MEQHEETGPAQGTEEYEKLKVRATAECVADLMLLISSTMRAIPEATEPLSAIQNLLARLMTVSLGPDWAEENNEAVTKAIDERLEATKARVMQMSGEAHKEPAPHKVN